jgi:hypothetical protein
MVMREEELIPGTWDLYVSSQEDKLSPVDIQNLGGGVLRVTTYLPNGDVFEVQILPSHSRARPAEARNRTTPEATSVAIQNISDVDVSYRLGGDWVRVIRESRPEKSR